MTILVDTNAFSDWAKNRRWWEEMGIAETVYIPAIVLGELIHGFRNGSFFSENMALLGEFLDEPTVQVAEIKHRTAEYYSELLTECKKSGRNIPTNDIWIAASAIEHGATLLTRDGHFRAFANLKVQFGDW